MAVLLVVVLGGCGSARPTCNKETVLTPSPPSNAEPVLSASAGGTAELALRYEPTVMMSEFDRFWPVSVATILKERDLGGRGVQLWSDGHVTTHPPTLGALKPSGAASDYLEYPAGLADKAAQMRVFLRGLGLSEPVIDIWPTNLQAVARRSAQIYFYDAGVGCSYPGADTTSYRALQYWFFYAFNYYPMTVDTATMERDPLAADNADIDLHEGDWEHITVLVQSEASGYVPRFVWMARHASEGVLIPWDEVKHDAAGHPVVYPALGGHPSYPDCGAHPRALLAAAVYDYVGCTQPTYVLSGAATPLVSLAEVSWSCWPGHFGTTDGTAASSNADDPTGAILVAGPPSPLRQAENHACP